MAKYFKRGAYNLRTSITLSARQLLEVQGIKALPATVGTTEYTLRVLIKLGFVAPFVKTLIIRGIGYRAFIVENDFRSKTKTLTSTETEIRGFLTNTDNEELDVQFWTSIGTNEYPHARYLVIRAGHTKDLFVALPEGVYAKTLKKDRKLVLYSASKPNVSSTAAQLAEYRKPSVYTGRGLRLKAIRVRRKAGKQDKQK